jgi:hypothetical protein
MVVPPNFLVSLFETRQIRIPTDSIEAVSQRCCRVVFLTGPNVMQGQLAYI